MQERIQDMKPDETREEELFAAAVQLPVEDIGAYLDQSCADDPALRRRVEALLGALERAGPVLKDPPSLASARPATLLEKPGDRIGRYKLLEQIGEGGYGIVYVAEQEHPVRRRVALKVIKVGMDTRQVMARFEAERQALAMMDHPNISRVFDAGATETGRPYFVMELVRGVRITDYCAQNHLASGERLDLFVQVCRAIQHAHQKGIIHRDIKPANVLVASHDGVALPKVIDFGIAKAMPQLRERLTNQTVYTGFEQFMGTPAYMSPEQAEMSAIDIDTRTDIYSLGVLLYELLTGQTPFDAKELLSAGLDAMRRTIREVEPVKPSTRLTQERATAGSTKSKIQNPKSKIEKDLDWIVMKCLEKDRARRYETANGLATDIQRYLGNQPVSARPPGGVYQFRKWIRRNKVAFGAASAVVLAALLAIVVLITSNVRIAGARRSEQAERVKSDAANRELRQTVSLLELQRAESFFHAGDCGLGAAHLAMMLKRDPSNDIAANRLVSALVHRQWALRDLPALRHPDMVSRACFSLDGRRVLSVCLDHNVRIWDADVGQVTATLQHRDAITSAAYSPDGALIVTASADGTAQIWSATNGAPVAPPLRHDGKVHWVEFSPDGRRIVTASSDQTARIWDTATGKLRHVLRGHTNDVLFARFSPDGERIATGSKWGSTRLWSAESGEPLFALEGRSHVVGLAFSADGRRLATAGEDRVARLWNPVTGERVGESMRHERPIHHLTFHPSSRLLVTSSQDGRVRFWDATSGARVGNVLAHDGGVLFAEFSRDGKRIVTASLDNSARVWDVRTGALLCQPLRHVEMVNQASFSPDGLRLVTASQDRHVQIWDLSSRRDEGHEAVFGDQVKSVAFSADGTLLAVASLDGTARVLDAVSGQFVSEPLRQESRVGAVDFSPDGQRVVTGAANGQVCIWNWRSGRLLVAPLQHSNLIRSVRFSPEGERVLTASLDGTARVWKAATGAPLTPALKHDGPVLRAQFSHDGQRVATASEDKSARVWDAQTGEPLTPPLWHGDELRWVEFSRDDRKVATASADNTARVWDAQTGRPITPPLSHTRTVDRARFSFDGRLVATASIDQTARIWDAATGQALTAPLKHNWPASQLCFSPDGKRLATGDWNGDVRVWDVQTGQPLTDWLDANGGLWDICFDPAGQRLATASFVARLWDVPATPVPVPDWLPHFADALAGVRLSTRGNLEFVPQSEFATVVKNLGDKGRGQLYERLARSFLHEPNRAEPPQSEQRNEKVTQASPPMREIAPRSSNTPSHLIDLSRYYNASFDDEWHSRFDPRNKHNDMSNVPRGEQTFDGISFDVRGIVQLSSRLQQQWDPSYPSRVEGIKVQRPCRQLHLLHATGWNTGEGAFVCSYIVHWADGREQAIPMQFAADIGEWWSPGNRLAAASRATLAWSGKNPRNNTVGFYHRSWSNPRPEVAIETIDFISYMTDAAPFLVAMTAE